MDADPAMHAGDPGIVLVMSINKRRALVVLVFGTTIVAAVLVCDQWEAHREVKELKALASRGGLSFVEPIKITFYNAESSPFGFELRTWQGWTPHLPKMTGLNPLRPGALEYGSALDSARSYFGLEDPSEI